MRKNPTEAEGRLWKILRLKALGGYRFRRQFPVAGFILDFYCLSHRLAIELDGGQHGDPRRVADDQARTRKLNQLGIHVLRFWDHEFLKYPEVVAEEILRALESQSCRPPPHPSPTQ